jgi:Holliday junction resolvase RusA-like endonuclease
VPLAFIIPGRPKAWKRPGRDKRSGRRFESKQTKIDRETVARCARAAWRGPPSTKPVKILVLAIFEIPKSWPPSLQREAEAGRVYHTSDPDKDNLEKLVMDALKQIVFVDDNQVADGRTIKRYGRGARTEVYIEELEGALKTPSQTRLEGPRQARLPLPSTPVDRLPAKLRACVIDALQKGR